MIKERGNPLFHWLDRWVGIPLTVPANIYRKIEKTWLTPVPGNRIGIICLGAVGDLLLSSVLVNGIKSLIPGASIEFITSHANSQALPLLPHIAQSFSASITQVDILLNYIRSRNYGILFDTGQWARFSALLSSLSRARCTVGFRTSGQWRGAGYDLSVPHKYQHETDNFRALGSAVWGEFCGTPELNLPPHAARSRVICCHMWPAPGRGRRLKEWPEEYWAELIGFLLGRGWEVTLSGSPADSEANQGFIAKFFGTASRIHSLAGKLTLPELGKYFTTVAGVVAVNTGPMHLAALAGVPTIGLHGATNPGRWGPVGANAVSLTPRQGEYGYLDLGWEYPRKARAAMAFLPVEDVVAALDKIVPNF